MGSGSLHWKGMDWEKVTIGARKGENQGPQEVGVEDQMDKFIQLWSVPSPHTSDPESLRI